MLHVPACTPGTVSSSGAPCASTSPSQPPTPIPPLHWLTTNSARRAGRNRWQTAPLARTVARPRRHARLAPATASARPGRARAHAMAAIAAPAPARASRAPVRARPGPPASFCPRVMALAHCTPPGAPYELRTVCPQNTFSAPGATSCTACPVGSSSVAGSSSCSCNAGYALSGGVCTGSFCRNKAMCARTCMKR